jgi:hypothetical protein
MRQSSEKPEHGCIFPVKCEFRHLGSLVGPRKKRDQFINNKKLHFVGKEFKNSADMDISGLCIDPGYKVVGAIRIGLNPEAGVVPFEVLFKHWEFSVSVHINSVGYRKKLLFGIGNEAGDRTKPGEKTYSISEHLLTLWMVSATIAEQDVSARGSWRLLVGLGVIGWGLSGKLFKCVGESVTVVETAIICQAFKVKIAGSPIMDQLLAIVDTITIHVVIEIDPHFAVDQRRKLVSGYSQLNGQALDAIARLQKGAAVSHQFLHLFDDLCRFLVTQKQGAAFFALGGAPDSMNQPTKKILHNDRFNDRK